MDDVIPIGRIGNGVRMRIHLTGGLDAAEKQDHDGDENQDGGNHQNQVLEESWNGFSHPTWAGYGCFHELIPSRDRSGNPVYG